MSKPKTYWNGVECDVEEVKVILADAPEFPQYWARDLVGQERNVLKVILTKVPINAEGDIEELDEPEIFYIDNEDGSGMKKVTEGMGMWQYGHRDIRVEREIK